MTEPPHSHEAEAAVISCLLSDSDGTLTDQAIGAGLTPDSFYSSAYRMVCAAIYRIRGADAVPDAISVSQDMKAAGDLEAIGGVVGVEEMADRGGSLVNFGRNVEVILRTAAQRGAIRHLAAANEELHQVFGSTEDMMTAVQPHLARAENAFHRQQSVRTLATVVDEVATKMDQPHDTNDTITTGLGDFDRYATGIQRHELVVIAARPSVGKSSLSRQIAWHAAKQGKRVAVFLLETSDASFVEACAAQESRIPTAGLRVATVEGRQRYAATLRRIRGMSNLRLYDRDNTVDALESRCRLLKAAYVPRLVVIDYLQLVRGGNPKLSTADRIGEITSRMVGMVKFLGCPILLMSQLSRSQERDNNRQPVLSDLRDSGHIESDSHRVVFIHRPTKDRNGMDQLSDAYRDVYHCSLVQAKNRDGPRCCVDVDFRSPIATFEDAAR